MRCPQSNVRVWSNVFMEGGKRFEKEKGNDVFLVLQVGLNFRSLMRAFVFQDGANVHKSTKLAKMHNTFRIE